MRFRRIEVQSFRAIRRAAVDFGPGLNVLFGPNDLGKTTLASAMRAALLLPVESSAHQAFLPWQATEPPRVTLSFEVEGRIWRIQKTFGQGSAASAKLDTSADGSSFHEEARGRAVERRVRELLGWGIEAPGGKSGTRGLPESFLSHVLLAGQSDVPQILERSLGADRDDSGRQRLHEALQALAQDPLFKRVLDAAQAKVDVAFTPQGRKRAGQASPFTSIKEQIQQLVADYERFSRQRRESEEVQARVARLAEERLAAEAAVAALESSVTAKRAALEEAEAQRAVRQRHEEAARRLSELRAKDQELSRLSAEVEAARTDEEAQAEAARVAAQELDSARAALGRAQSVLDAQVGEAARARVALRRGALERKVSEAAAGLERDRELLERVRELHSALQAHARERQLVERVECELSALRERSETLEHELAQARRLDAFCRAREALAAAERARSARAAAEQLRSAADRARERAHDARADAQVVLVSAEELSELGRLEAEKRVARARLDVGLAVRVQLAEGRDAILVLDAEKRTTLSRAAAQLVHARSHVSVDVPDVVRLEVAAGDPELRQTFEMLERRWSESVGPLLARAGVSSLDELAGVVERQRERARQAEEAEREALALDGRAEEKDLLGAELESWEARAARWAAGVSDEELGELSERASRLGPDWEKDIAAEISRGEAECARVKARLEAEARRVAAAEARLEGLSRDVERARARHGQRCSELEPDGGAPSVELAARRVADGERALAEASAELAWFAREAETELTAARRACDEARAAEREAAAALEHREAASRAARERCLELNVRLRERQLHFDPAELTAAAAELSRCEAELKALPPLPDASAAEVAELEAELVRARAHERHCTGELRRAEGALGQIGGDVAAHRERQVQEALERAREAEVDLERDYEAYRLLTETLRAVENEQGIHLGRALERPVSERFERLTQGRYDRVELDAELGLRGVLVLGRHRGYRELSEGTQEQLATILRMCIAEHLGMALVLDDHLAQTHRMRAEWFRQALREAAQRIQIIVLTARPEDLLLASEMPGRESPVSSVGNVRAVDLERVIDRASYRPRPVDHE